MPITAGALWVKAIQIVSLAGLEDIAGLVSKKELITKAGGQEG